MILLNLFYLVCFFFFFFPKNYRWVTMFRTVWNENKRFGYDHPHFVIGNMNHPISVFAAETGSKLIDLYDEDRITAVPGCNSVHPTSDRLAIISANASGRVVLWS